jgi:hypothetical protein
LWLAFASREAFAEVTNQVFPNWFDLPPAISHYGDKARLVDSEMFELPPFIFKRAAFQRLTNMNPLIVYQVKSYTTNNGIIVPLSFESETHHLDAKGGVDARIMDRVSAVVTSLSFDVQPVIADRIQSLSAAIEDRRFRDDTKVGRSLFYIGNSVRVLNPAAVPAVYKGAVPEKAKRSLSVLNAPVLVFCILAVTALAPIVFALLTKAKKRGRSY